ncbi:hypothetical protein DFQ28_003106 [Apophysomyces sp. BC1034]|nr:hypothetical protein DFQ30_009974 [Apophysomyces sp. BC1015]KAG0183161.1 hypothetical protein DFQ29_009237 [Apophysomyces sp. BC1021]KAG0189678.1 hypothetical protein DFQ28_003106 [Apophysomyces sp. BC1034]
MENSGQSSDADKIRLKRLAKLQQEADDRKKREAEEAQNRPEKSAPVKLREPLPTKEPLEVDLNISAALVETE